MESRGIRRVAFALTTVCLTLSAVPLHALDGSVTPIVVPDNVVPHTTRTDAFGINERGQIVEAPLIVSGVDPASEFLGDLQG